MENAQHEMMSYLANSIKELSRIFAADRHVTVQMAEVVKSIPDRQPFDNETVLLERSDMLFRNITAYLNGIANLEDTVAQQLGYAMQALREPADSE